MYWRTVTQALICSVFFSQPILIADDADDALAAVEAAEIEFDRAYEAARETVTADYQQEILNQSAAGKTENVTRLTTGLQFFQAEGMLLDPELEEAYLVFGNESKAARDRLLKAYQDGTTKLAAAGRLDEIQDIQQRIRNRGLVSKLVSIQLTATPTQYLMHADYKGLVREIPPELRLNATFEMVSGLSAGGIVREDTRQPGIQGKPSEIVSFRSVSVPNHFLTHWNFDLQLQTFADTDGFRKNSSFKIQKGLWRPSGVSFEAVNLPNHFLVMKPDGGVRFEKQRNTAEFARSATFSITRPKFPFWQEP